MNRIWWIGVGTLAFMVAMIAAPAPIAAQDAVIGIKGGINSYSVAVDPDDPEISIGHKTGFSGGVFGGVTLTGVVGLQLEGLYTERTISDRDNGERVAAKYFEIPLLITAKFPLETTLMRPILFAGPSVSFQSDCQYVSGGEDQVSVDCDDPGPWTKDPVWAIVFGAGVDYPLGNFLIGGEFRYDLGLTNLIDISDATGSIKGRLWAILLTVGYAL